MESKTVSFFTKKNYIVVNINSLTKKQVANNNNQFKKDLDILKTVLLSFIGWSVLVPLVTLSAVYRKLVDLVLKLRWRKQYGGLFDGRDVMYFMPSDKDSWICSITSVFYIKCQRQADVFSAVMKTLQEKVSIPI